MEAYKDGRQVVWDATSITAASTCPRKYYYQILNHWSAQRTSIHLVFGKIFATALEDFFLYSFNPDFEYETALQETIKWALEETDKEPIFETESKKTRLALCRAIIHYLDKYFDHDRPRIFMAGGVPGIELTFAVEIGEDWVLTGRMDRVVEDENGVQILDQKTSGGPLNQGYFANYTPNHQVSAYLLAGRTIFPNGVKTMLIDAITIAGGKIDSKRANIARNAPQLDEWVDNTRSLIKSIHSYDPENATAFPQNPSACGMYGGCPFRGICSSSPEVRPILLNDDFEQRVWNPVKGLSSAESK